MKQLSKKLCRSVRFPINAGLAISGCLALHSALAGGPEIPQFVVPMTPGVSVAGNFIDFNSGWADALVPLFRTTPSSFLYLDPQGLYHNNNQYSASVGGGFRMLTQSAGILGAYVFGDYNHSQQNNSYWFVSPGLERLGDTLGFSVNGYFPVSSQRNNTTSGFASQFGDTDDISFSGHSEFDNIVQNFESTGVGVDGEIGYRLPFLRNNTKLYLGGYYFSPKDNDSITGGIAKLEVPVNNLLSLTVSDAYDNIFHNTFRAGASLSLWGRSTHFYDHSLEMRMVDPIQRNRIAQEGHSGTDQYITEGQETIGQGLLASNLWFFAPGAAPGPLLTDTANAVTPTSVSLSQCTAENPCAATDVNTNFFAGINLVSANAKMFLAPGTYSNLTDGLSPISSLTLNPGQSMYGRTADYKLSAGGNDRALLIGDVNLFSNNMLNSLRLGNDGTQAQGVLINSNATNVGLFNVLVGNIGSNPSQAYATGVGINSNDQVSIDQSEIDAFSTTGNITGINITGANSFVDILNSSIDAVTNTSNDSATGVTASQLGAVNTITLVNDQINLTAFGPLVIDDFLVGVENSGNDIFTLIDNQITVANMSGSSSSSNNGAIGVESLRGGSTTLTNNSINVSVAAANNSSTPEGVGAASGSTGLFTLTNNSITVSAGQSSIAIVLGGTAPWILTSNTVTATTVGGAGSSIGIGSLAILHNTTLTLSGNQIVVNSPGTAYGIRLQNYNNVSVSSNNDLIMVNSTGAGQNAYGIAANVAGSSSGNTISLMNDTIQVTAAGSAYGVFDTTGNTWVPNNNSAAIAANNNITAISTGGGAACQVSLNGGCTN